MKETPYNRYSDHPAKGKMDFSALFPIARFLLFVSSQRDYAPGVQP